MKRKRKGEKKIISWISYVEFKKVMKRECESLKQSDKTQPEKTYENSMETGREICGESTGNFRIKRNLVVEWEGPTSD